MIGGQYREEDEVSIGKGIEHTSRMKKLTFRLRPQGRMDNKRITTVGATGESVKFTFSEFEVKGGLHPLEGGQGGRGKG